MCLLQIDTIHKNYKVSAMVSELKDLNCEGKIYFQTIFTIIYLGLVCICTWFNVLRNYKVPISCFHESWIYDFFQGIFFVLFFNKVDVIEKSFWKHVMNTLLLTMVF